MEERITKLEELVNKLIQEVEILESEIVELNLLLEEKEGEYGDTN